MGALVVLAAQAGTVDPGGVGECVVLVRNTADEHDSFDVLVHGPASVWASCDPAVIDVPPGDEVSAWVRFHVPRDAGIAPGPVDFAVTVSSRNNAEFVYAERGEIVIAGYARLAAAIEPLVVTRRGVVVPVNVSNAGTAPLMASVTARGDVHARRVVVPPGESTTVALDIARRRGTDRVTVDVISGNGDELSLAAAIPDEGRSLRRDLTRSAAVLGGFLVAAFLVVGTVGDSADQQPRVVAVAPFASSTTVAAGVADDDANAVDDDAAAGPATTEVPPAATASPAPAPVPVDLPAIAFVRWYGPGDRDLVVRSAGRSGTELRLRSPGSTESAPDLSPDATRVAYVQERGGEWLLCVAPAIGGDAACYGEVDATSSVAWRPDATGVYAVRDERLVEFTVNAAPQTEPTRHDVEVPGGHFSLSPDGTRVALVEASRIVIRPLSGGDALVLHVPGAPKDPAWTHTADRIVYSFDTQLFSAPLGDGPIHQLTAPGTVNGDPVVAGSWVVFRSNRSGGGDLYAVAADASGGKETGLALITRAAERDTDPAV